MDRCSACGGRLVVDWERGEVVCIQCGLVASEVVDVGPEWRFFDKRRVRAAPFKRW